MVLQRWRFTGFTPTLSVSVWVGFDRSIRMRDANGVGISGGRGAAPIWADFMIRATDGEPAREFAVPSDIHFEALDPVSGEIANQWTRNAVQVALRSSQVAADMSGQHTANTAERTAVQAADPFSTGKSEPTFIEQANPPFIRKPDKSTITEEDLPPDSPR